MPYVLRSVIAHQARIDQAQRALRAIQGTSVNSRMPAYLQAIAQARRLADMERMLAVLKQSFTQS